MKKYVFGIILLVSFSFFFAIFSEEPKEEAVVEQPPFNIFKEARGKVLRWKLEPGDVVEIKKVAQQHVIITDNTQKSELDREVIHWITLNTLDKNRQHGYHVEGTFSTQIRQLPKKGTAFQADELYFSKFYIAPIGKYYVPGEQYMPNVRHIPIFPDKKDPANVDHPLKEGDSWARVAEEIVSGKILYRVPIEANYVYLGKKTIKRKDKTKTLHKIKISLAINYTIKDGGKNDPQNIFGYATALLAWDEEEGIPYLMREEINLTLIYGNGLTHEFAIKSLTRYKKKKSFTKADKNQFVNDLKEAVKGDEGTKITQDENGIKIELPDVFFDFDSDKLSEEAAAVLQKITKVLEAYPNKRVLIRGHTDNVGKAKYNYNLSKGRALRVLRYLTGKSKKLKLDNFSYHGEGSDSPVAPNSTSEGRKKNRRVEIIILDN
ncbi:MAG: OmpA family protein [Leptospirales bacterium]